MAQKRYNPKEEFDNLEIRKNKSFINQVAYDIISGDLKK